MDHPDGTTVPQDWVLPQCPTDEIWATALDRGDCLGPWLTPILALERTGHSRALYSASYCNNTCWRSETEEWNWFYLRISKSVLNFTNSYLVVILSNWYLTEFEILFIRNCVFSEVNKTVLFPPAWHTRLLTMVSWCHCYSWTKRRGGFLVTSHSGSWRSLFPSVYLLFTTFTQHGCTENLLTPWPAKEGRNGRITLLLVGLLINQTNWIPSWMSSTKIVIVTW